MIAMIVPTTPSIVTTCEASFVPQALVGNFN